MYVSLKLLAIVFIFTEHVLTKAFILVTLFILQETYLFIRDSSKLFFQRVDNIM